MQNSLFDRICFTCWFAAPIALLSGCTTEPELGSVAGKLVIPGHSAEAVRVEFHPDAAAKTLGPSSIGETDADGNFQLSCALGNRAKAGAILGRHRVVLQDLRLAQSETGRGIPQRFSAQHSSVLTTPLGVEVHAGEQTIEIRPGEKR